MIDPAPLPATAARFYGVLAIIAPVLFLISDALYVTVGGGINNGVLGGTIGVLSAFTLAAALVGICRLLEPRMPRYSLVLTLFALIATTGGTAFNIAALYEGAFGIVVPDQLPATEAIGMLAFLPWGWFAPLIFVLLGIALWRARVVPWWHGVLFVLGGVLFISARPARIDLLALSTDIVLLAALTIIGVRMIAGSTKSIAKPAAVP